MDPLVLAGLIITALGTGFSIAVVLRGRQLSRASLAVTIGPPDLEQKFHRADRGAPIGALVVATHDSAAPRIVAVPIGIKNASSIPVSELMLRLEYPVINLVDRVSIPSEKGVRIAFRSRKEREVVELSGMASVSIDLELLRPGDAMLTGELFALVPTFAKGRALCPAFDDLFKRAETRFASIGGFIGLVPVSLYIRASNVPPLALKFLIIWIQAASPTHATNIIEQIVAAAWEGKWPKPGLYLKGVGTRKFWHRHRLVILFLSSEGRQVPTDPAALFEDSLTSPGGTAVYDLPPWGLDGSSFDLKSVIGPRVWSRRSQGSGKEV